MKSWGEYIKVELKKEPGVMLFSYPYSFLWRNIDENTVKGAWQKTNRAKEKIVYIHIPFCKRKCFFCGFVSYFHSPYQLIRKYVHYLKKEMEVLLPCASSLPTVTLQIGGGTPSLLGEKELGDIFQTIHRLANLRKETEISIDIFPDDSITAAKLKLLKASGVNRISLGIQTFDDRIKKICNRFDTRRRNIEIYNLARKIGFQKINFDLIFGLPHQTLKSWLDTLSLTVELGPENICVMSLVARHPKLAFYKHVRNADVRRLLGIFYLTRRFLIQRGYTQVSKSYYVKKGFSYNFKNSFQSLVPVLGLGLNSISENDNLIYKNTQELNRYFTALHNDKLPIQKGYMRQGKDRIRNYVINKFTYLRIDREEFRNYFKKDIRYYFYTAIRSLAKFKLIKVGRKSIELTPKGMFYTALVNRCFYDFKVLKKKEELYKNIS
jgi:oxygen-independent coproporphyrinogen-3 oxidase